MQTQTHIDLFTSIGVKWFPNLKRHQNHPGSYLKLQTPSFYFIPTDWTKLLESKAWKFFLRSSPRWLSIADTFQGTYPARMAFTHRDLPHLVHAPWEYCSWPWLTRHPQPRQSPSKGWARAQTLQVRQQRGLAGRGMCVWRAGNAGMGHMHPDFILQRERGVASTQTRGAETRPAAPDRGTALVLGDFPIPQSSLPSLGSFSRFSGVSEGGRSFSSCPGDHLLLWMCRGLVLWAWLSSGGSLKSCNIATDSGTISLRVGLCLCLGTDVFIAQGWKWGDNMERKEKELISEIRFPQ